MDKKVLYFDVETTGRNWARNDIIQLGLIVEVNGQVKEEADIKCQPIDWDSIEPEALAVNGLTVEQLKTYQPSTQAYNQLLEILGKYVDKYNKEDKFYPAGYNLDFDLNFLQGFFKKHQDDYFGSWINWKRLDPLPLLFSLDFKGELSLPNYKLATVADYYGIELQAHDAMSDIRATRELWHKLNPIG